MCQKGNSGRRDDTGALNRRSPGDEASRESSGDPVARFSCVHAEQNAWRRCRGGKCVGEGKSNRIDGGSIERRLAGDGAAAIGSKERLHEVVSSGRFSSSS